MGVVLAGTGGAALLAALPNAAKLADAAAATVLAAVRLAPVDALLPRRHRGGSQSAPGAGDEKRGK